MRDYGMVSPRFWIGETGRKLRKFPDAQRIAMYLLTAPMADMTGVFYCPVATILNDVGEPCEPSEAPLKGFERGFEGAPKGLPSPFEGASDPLVRGFQGAPKWYDTPLEGHQRALEGVKRALLTLQELGFCFYDFESEYVFVKEMARWQIAPKLKAADNRSKGLRKTVENMPNPMRARFIARYNEDFSLGFDEKEVEKMLSESNPLASPFEGPCKALRSQEQEQEQEQDISTRVSNETLSSANANASESEPAEEKQTDLFEKDVAAATVGRTPADAKAEIKADSPQTGEIAPADALAPKSAKRNPPVPYQKVVDLYNAKCTPALAAARLTDKRKDDIRKRWHEMQEYTGAKTEEETLAEFGKFFDRVSRSDFLKGLKTSFKADFPWLMESERIEPVFAGRYDNREGGAIARNRAEGTSPLPDHLNPHLRFDEAYYTKENPFKPDGSLNWKD